MFEIDVRVIAELYKCEVKNIDKDTYLLTSSKMFDGMTVYDIESEFFLDVELTIDHKSILITRIIEGR